MKAELARERLQGRIEGFERAAGALRAVLAEDRRAKSARTFFDGLALALFDSVDNAWAARIQHAIERLEAEMVLTHSQLAQLHQPRPKGSLARLWGKLRP